jgi:phosphopantetheinyl transferase
MQSNIFISRINIAVAGISDVVVGGLFRLHDEEPARRESLTPEEFSEYECLCSPGRRKEWLCARTALKTLSLESGLIDSHLHSTVVKDNNGRPAIRITGKKLQTLLPCSISHKHGLAAVCFGRDPISALGIDIEEISLRPWRARSSFYRRGDCLRGVGAPADHYSALWACKEAVSKAMGTGINIDPKELGILGNEFGVFSCAGERRQKYSGFYSIQNNFVLALSVLLPEGNTAVEATWSNNGNILLER